MEIDEMTAEELRLEIAKARGWSIKQINDHPERWFSCHFSMGSVGAKPIDALDKEADKVHECVKWPYGISAAWELVEEVQAEPYEQWVKIERTPAISQRWIVAIGNVVKAAPTAALGICRAYLEWKRGFNG